MIVETMSSCSTIVAANSSLAAGGRFRAPGIDEDQVPPGQELGIRTVHRVQGGNLAAGVANAASPSFNGDFNEPMSKTSPVGFSAASSVRTCPDTAIGVATTITS